MEGLEDLLARVREEATTRGPTWVQVQLAAMAPSTSSQPAGAKRKSRPPERLSPDPHARQRRNGSPHGDPPAPPAKRASASASGAAGRNPHAGRGSSGGATSATEASAPPATSSGSNTALGTRSAQRAKQAQRTNTATTGAASAQDTAAAQAPSKGGKSSAKQKKKGGSAGPSRKQSQRGASGSNSRSGQQEDTRSTAHPIPSLEPGSASEVESLAGEEIPEATGSGLTAVQDAGPAQPGAQTLVWILGHSYVAWGAKRADMRPEGRQLGFPRDQVCIRWLGFPGMVWSRVLPELHRFARLDRAPDILVLHVGGNDLASRSTRVICKDIKFDFLRIRSFFPSTIVVWSDVVARTTWRLARSVQKINKARVKLNKEVSKYVIRNGGLAIRHRELEEDILLFLRRDGVHLNAIGTDLWALGIEEGIERALRLGASQA
ncbi:pneumococcal serine-rich repeat protein-like [Hyperolius riggenbachi]|uniref:pneumococcal serine-rich repeat protein-like n=2 Tax=Hyperolius riggenbachi TaxID=752182 RepID=UPI0035A39E73